MTISYHVVYFVKVRSVVKCKNVTLPNHCLTKIRK